MSLTTEQQDIIDHVRSGHHVSVDALPGSGKSRVAYDLIRQCTDDQVVIMIMYNRSLCDASLAQIRKLELAPSRQVQAFTFHGLASSLTGTVCHSDLQILQALGSLRQNRPTWIFENFTLLVIDEAQDIRPVFMTLIHYLIRSVCVERSRLRIVLLGDPRQLLYGFYRLNRADSRYLSLAQHLLRTCNTFPWKHCRLTCSFRSTPAIACFLNALVPGQQMVAGGVGSAPVILDVCDVYTLDPSSKILALVSPYSPEDVLILCASLNSRSPAQKMVRTLVRHGIPVHVQRSGDLSGAGPPTAPLLSGRIRFKTFCASKGLEAKLVVLLNTESLFQNMPNSLYVALSRSQAQLVVFQQASVTSHTEIQELLQSVQASDLTVIQNTKRPFPQERYLPPDRPSRPKQNAEDLFTYVDPQLLLPLEARLQLTSSGEASFEDEEFYVRMFEVTNSAGLVFNVRTILVTAMRLAVEYFRTRKLLPRIVALETSEDPYIRQLSLRGQRLLGIRLPFHEDPWCLEQLYVWLPAFAMFATALDARQSFDDKITGLDDFGFILCPPIIRRVRRILEQMYKYIPDTTTKFSIRRCRRIDQQNLYSQPTLRTPACLYSLVHQPLLNPEDHLTMAVHLCVHRVEYGYVSNIYTGSLVQVYLPLENQCTFLRATLRARDCCEDDLPDHEFLLRHQLPPDILP